MSVNVGIGEHSDKYIESISVEYQFTTTVLKFVRIVELIIILFWALYFFEILPNETVGIPWLLTVLKTL